MVSQPPPKSQGDHVAAQASPGSAGGVAASAGARETSSCGAELAVGLAILWSAQPIVPSSFSAVADMSGMFTSASSFIQQLHWDTSAVADVSGMFASASSIQSTSLHWDTSRVTKSNRALARGKRATRKRHDRR